jgi:putative tryptophan/tyrosine transport system substrate-binding protein
MRKTVTCLALCAMLLALCASAQAQQPAKVPRVGVFLPASASSTAHLVEAFRQGLREHGYVGKQNLTLEARYAEGKVERLAGLAAELVHFKVDVMVVGSTPGVMAAKNATDAIPIVIVTTGDPVAGGLVASLARPGGNITGLTASGKS